MGWEALLPGLKSVPSFLNNGPGLILALRRPAPPRPPPPLTGCRGSRRWTPGSWGWGAGKQKKGPAVEKVLLLWVWLLAWLQLPWLPAGFGRDQPLGRAWGGLGAPPHCLELSLVPSPCPFPSGHSSEGPTAPFSLLHPLPIAGPPPVPRLSSAKASLDSASLPETTRWQEKKLAVG